ncbi:hypothetical protein DIPPA_34558 [Diplonema papillatum]|nr:hypothetical protein DIPPA_34558 [Diplonema papillatum]
MHDPRPRARAGGGAAGPFKRARHDLVGLALRGQARQRAERPSGACVVVDYPAWGQGGVGPLRVPGQFSKPVNVGGLVGQALSERPAPAQARLRAAVRSELFLRLVEDMYWHVFLDEFVFRDASACIADMHKDLSQRDYLPSPPPAGDGGRPPRDGHPSAAVFPTKDRRPTHLSAVSARGYLGCAQQRRSRRSGSDASSEQEDEDGGAGLGCPPSESSEIPSGASDPASPASSRSSRRRRRRAKKATPRVRPMTPALHGAASRRTSEGEYCLLKSLQQARDAQGPRWHRRGAAARVHRLHARGIMNHKTIKAGLTFVRQVAGSCPGDASSECSSEYSLPADAEDDDHDSSDCPSSTDIERQSNGTSTALREVAKEKDLLMSRMACHYVALFRSLRKEHTDRVVPELPHLLARVLWLLFDRTVPYYKPYMHAPFDTNLLRRTSYWLSGVETGASRYVVGGHAKAGDAAGLNRTRRHTHRGHRPGHAPPPPLPEDPSTPDKLEAPLHQPPTALRRRVSPASRPAPLCEPSARKQSDTGHSNPEGKSTPRKAHAPRRRTRRPSTFGEGSAFAAAPPAEQQAGAAFPARRTTVATPVSNTLHGNAVPGFKSPAAARTPRCGPVHVPPGGGVVLPPRKLTHGSRRESEDSHDSFAPAGQSGTPVFKQRKPGPPVGPTASCAAATPTQDLASVGKLSRAARAFSEQPSSELKTELNRLRREFADIRASRDRDRDRDRLNKQAAVPSLPPVEDPSQAADGSSSPSAMFLADSFPSSFELRSGLSHSRTPTYPTAFPDGPPPAILPQEPLPPPPSCVVSRRKRRARPLPQPPWYETGKRDKFGSSKWQQAYFSVTATSPLFTRFKTLVGIIDNPYTEVDMKWAVPGEGDQGAIR